MSVENITKDLKDTKIQEEILPPPDTPEPKAETKEEKAIVEAENKFFSSPPVASTNAKHASIYHDSKSFEQLGISAPLLKGIWAMKFTSPSRIQSKALPLLLSDPPQNLIGQAHHGSGKTATFCLAMLNRLNPEKNCPQALCICPTREIANQIYDVSKILGKELNIRHYCAVPGSHRDPITEHVVIGTPGTLITKFRLKLLDPSELKILVLDEADQMVSKGSLRDQTLIIWDKIPKGIQVLLFSATFPEYVQKFALKVCPRAHRITIKKEELTLAGIKQFYLDCDTQSKKYDMLTSLYGLLDVGQCIIFVQTVATAKELANKMREDGYTISLLHGKDMSVEERDKVMAEFRQGTTSVLISTNVLSRGIDILQVTLVINYDIPIDVEKRPDPEVCSHYDIKHFSYNQDLEHVYIHRIGRSGRFGRKGVAINFVYDDISREDLNYIAKYFGVEIHELPSDFEKLAETVKNALK